jgi:hypothetical protein
VSVCECACGGGASSVANWASTAAGPGVARGCGGAGTHGDDEDDDDSLDEDRLVEPADLRVAPGRHERASAAAPVPVAMLKGLVADLGLVMKDASLRQFGLAGAPGA